MILNDKSSSLELINCGVPQGSILATLLFFLYVYMNDLVNVSIKLLLMLFADDSNAFISGKDVAGTLNEENLELEKLESWLNANVLGLNLSKTHFLVFSHLKKQLQDMSRDIMIQQTVITWMDCTKFLGVATNDKLNWKDHIQHVHTKTSRNIGILYRA